MGDRKTIWCWSLGGGVLSIGLLHPAIMTLAGLMIFVHDSGQTHELLNSLDAFSITMLPWNIGFGLLGVLCGYFYAKNKLARQMILENVRLQGVLEMAGAACHEMGQPIQVILGLTEVIQKKLDGTGLADEEIMLIHKQFDKLIDISRKIHCISRYSTKEYVGGINIINIDDASSAIPMNFKTTP